MEAVTSVRRKPNVQSIHMYLEDICQPHEAWLFLWLHIFAYVQCKAFDSYMLSDAMYTGFLTVELSLVIIHFPSEQSAHFIMEEIFTKSTIKAVQKHSTPKVNKSTNLIIHLKNSREWLLCCPCAFVLLLQ